MLARQYPLLLLLTALNLLSIACTGSASSANCTGVTCHNGGVCNAVSASPPCICLPPYIAPYCTSAANYCSTLQPDKGITVLPVCLNGGNCTTTMADPYFNCTCSPNYRGIRCAENATAQTTIATTTTSGANYCNTPQPDKGITALPVCLNGGSCTTTMADPYFTCTCSPNYRGIRCDENAIAQTTIATTTTGATPTFNTTERHTIGSTTLSKDAASVSVSDRVSRSTNILFGMLATAVVTWICNT